MQMKIGDLSRRSGVSIDTLRYYERIGLLPRTPRDAGGRRDYDEAALQWLAFLGRLKVTGMPLAEMRRYAVLRAAGQATANDRRALLEGHRARVAARIDEMQVALQALDVKIASYGSYNTKQEP
jgi:DNA-binding transcriptional MerR regulator